MPATVREGEVFAGKYRVERVLGEGGFGLVFAARNIELDETVAVKLLKHNGDRVTAERFFREARSASKIRGDGVARIYAVDQLEDGDLYMVMEYLEGRDLRREIVERGPLGILDAVDCILQTCDVIGRAHAIGIVHRDIKSANLFSVEGSSVGRRVKVLDFGIARSLDPAEVSLTQSSAMLGSPLYMAPEQMVDGRGVDERADIWGLGATLFELLTGEPPFGTGTIAQIVSRVQSKPPTRLRDLRPEVPAGLEAVVLTCLEKDREKRFADVGSLVAALAPWAAGDLGTADTHADIVTTLPLRRARVAPAPEVAPALEEAVTLRRDVAPRPPARPDEAPRAPRQLRALAAVALGLLFVAIAVTRYVRARSSPRDPEPAATSAIVVSVVPGPAGDTAAEPTTAEASAAPLPAIAPSADPAARANGPGRAKTIRASTARPAGASSVPSGPTPLPDDRQ
ncbi:MAG: protein kinase [Labilithrix sp.]|nr:protein kinase [Labilithrix sp.]